MVAYNFQLGFLENPNLNNNPQQRTKPMSKISRTAMALTSTLLALAFGSHAQANNSDPYIEWVNPQKSPMLYDFGVTDYSQKDNFYIGLKGGQATNSDITEDEKKSNIKYSVGNSSQKGNIDILVEENDEPTLYGVYGGYQFGNGFGIEAQYLESNATDIDKAKIKITDNSFTDLGNFSDGYISDAEVNYKVGSLAGTYKYRPSRNNNFYIKGKLGVSHVETEQEFTVMPEKQVQDNALAEKIKLKDRLTALNNILDTQSEDVGVNEIKLKGDIREAEAKLKDITVFSDGIKYSKDYNDTDWLAGIGFGYNFSNNMSVELEYERFNEDFDAVTLGVHYNF